MKTILTFATVMTFGLACASAFTLDFASVAVGNTPNNLVINVPGYGNVQLASTSGAVKTVFDVAANKNAMQMLNTEVVTVNFLGNPGVTITGIDAAPPNPPIPGTVVLGNPAPNIYSLQLDQPFVVAIGNVRSLTFVPEPATALLGALGSLLLFRRRRD